MMKVNGCLIFSIYKIYFIELKDHKIENNNGDQMTILTAINTDEGTWIGSDTQYSGSININGGPKWVVEGGWAVGYSGYTRGFNLIQDQSLQLVTDLEEDAEEFVFRLQELFDQSKWNTDEDVGPPNYGGQILLANPYHLWSICGTLSIVEVPKGQFYAVGDGAPYAFGCWYGINRMDYERTAMIVAINSAIHHSDSCGGHPWVYLLEKDNAN